MKSGFIAILGRPNVGKSSLMNAIVGEKVSIVSNKAQTTRDKILGILTENDYQMVFVDTPGFHKPQTKLGEYMDRCVKKAVEGVDAIVIVVDASRIVSESEVEFIKAHLNHKSVYVVLNKIDLVSFEKVYPILERLKPLLEKNEDGNCVKEIIPASTRSGKNIDVIKNFLISELKDTVQYYDSEVFTDKSERYLICEIIREKALWHLDEEIPHGIGVYIQRTEYEENFATIEADIICEKESHKAIVIGKKGDMLKSIGEDSRRDIEKLIGKKIYLNLFVKVRDNWRNNKNVLSDIGYDIKKDI